MTEQHQPGNNTRREFLQGGVAVAGAVLASSMLPVAHAETPGKRPNLLFFHMEGQRWDALSLAGNTILKTPNQDRIGREGVVFKNAFCTNALCAPSRTVTMTGMYSHSTGALDNSTENDLLPADIPLFTDLLREAGYEVAFCGKAHLKNGVRERYWDYYFGFNGPATNYYHPSFYEGRKGKMGGEVTYNNQYADDLATDRALTWLSEKRDKPFCLILSFNAPHSPFWRPRRYLDLYNGVPISKPSTFDDDLKGYPGKPRAFVEADNKIGTSSDRLDMCRSLEEIVKDYYACIVGVDDNIGRVYSWLEQSGQLDDTVILHTSDHGFFLGEWRFFDKRFMHEPSIRVPAMVRYPTKFRAGTVVNEMMLNLDIAPTLLELAGVAAPERMQGKSFVKLAQGKETNWRKDWLYEYYEYPIYERVRPHRGIRTERYKLIHYYMDPQEYELYDLQSDPGELHNLYGELAYQTVRQQLWQRLADLRRETGDTV
jgi:arylsulfatase A-like enzyme